MKLTKSIYIDQKGNEWIIQRNYLPKKKGEYIFWTGECVKLNMEVKEDKKSDLKKLIENKF
jgi:hypothetical protein